MTRSASTPVSVLLPLPEGPTISSRVPCADTVTGAPLPLLAQRQVVAREARDEVHEIVEQMLLDELHDAGRRRCAGDIVGALAERGHRVGHRHRALGQGQEGVVVLGVADPHHVVG